MQGAYQKDFVKAKPSYFSNDYARNSLFYSYILNLLRNKFTNIHGIFENLKRNTLKLEGKLEKKIKTIKEADFESFNGFENSTLSTTMTLGSRLNPIDSEENTEEYYSFFLKFFYS